MVGKDVFAGIADLFPEWFNLTSKIYSAPL